MDDWADNPRLNAWLAAQRRAFPAWSRQSGQAWDFTVTSVDRLERLLRARFTGWDDLLSAEEAEQPAVLVPGWYLGEVLNRRHPAALQPVHRDPWPVRPRTR
ncbi:hypothetical protein O7634_22475 [Micromonospora sp. WMMD1120]|uniref:hypothetical protein n=1 Tax=Micromonospora sp. WMMD1120 TaxID=3016106 RepID=UPI002416E84B|nr:hypothetical protein [Micromonospora sp. WMMD1120]MDG4809523.1 hypothetical protein [Micromonospora sp. WMMD1120]